MNYEKELQTGIEIANGYLWGLTNFKRFISQFLKYENDEDQWTMDYGIYCHTLFRIKDGNKPYMHPSEWAIEHYQESWDIEKMNKSLESLKEIISRSPVKR